MDEVEIEHGIPIPPSEKNSRGVPSARTRAYAKMEIGDSIFVLGENRSRAAASTCSWANYHKNGTQFTTQAIDGGVRIWRIK